jgi:hypothetical protein
MRMILPRADRRAHLRAFGFAVGAMVSIAIAALFHAAGARHPWVTGLTCGCLLAGFIWADETIGWRLYRGWNRYLAVPGARLAQRTVLRVCFLVIRLAGLVSRSTVRRGFAGHRPAWMARTSLPANGYERLFFSGTASDADGKGWKAEYRRWAEQGGHAWAVCLLPFLLLLRWVDPGEEKAESGNIYTLF